MRFSSCSKISIRVSFIVLLTLVGILAALEVAGTTASAASSHSYSVTKDILTSASATSLMRLWLANVTPTSPSMRLLVNRPVPSAGQGSPLPGLSMPHASDTPMVRKGGLLHNFNGISCVDSFKANGFDVEPADQGLCIGYPDIQQSPDGTVAMVVSVTGTTTNPSAGYLFRRAAAHATFGPVRIAALGATIDNGITCSLGRPVPLGGDYSAAQIDPSSSTIWFTIEYIPGTSSPRANWGARVFEARV